MSWAIGYDTNWNRDIGYGVPAICDFPGCNEKIDRGLSFVCGGEPYGGEKGCGLFFCGKHLYHKSKGIQLCTRCVTCKGQADPFEPKPDILEWVYFKMVDPSWAKWREENGLTPEKLNMKEEWDSYGIVLEPVRCNYQVDPYLVGQMVEFERIHEVGCKFAECKK
jgi:hypothetical protein